MSGKASDTATTVIGASTPTASTPTNDAKESPYTVTPKGGGDPFGVNSIHTAHRFLSEGDSVVNNKTKKALALPEPEKKAPAAKK